jgi:hypothetical protein
LLPPPTEHESCGETDAQSEETGGEQSTAMRVMRFNSGSSCATCRSVAAAVRLRSSLAEMAELTAACRPRLFDGAERLGQFFNATQA